MAEDRLLSALIAPESTKNEDHDADPTSINATIREIRKENRDEDRILRYLDFIFNPEKNNYEPKKLLVLLMIFNVEVLETKTKIYYLKIILM